MRGTLREQRCVHIGCCRAVPAPSTPALYRQRNWIERMIGHLKINRAVATRYDQLPNSFMVQQLVTGSNFRRGAV
jgi:hypothetical protein